MFDSGAVLAVFEEVAGIRLDEDTRAERAHDSVRVRFPWLGLEPGRVQVYVSPRDANDRLGGHFEVRIDLDHESPDEGVVGHRGLGRTEPDGPVGYVVYAQASRANVQLEFWSDGEEVTPKGEATWALLRACLQRL
jgi:hypothetical protein